MNEGTSAEQAQSAASSETSAPTAARLAWFWWALCLALIAASLLLEFLTPDYLNPQERPHPLLIMFSGLLSLACPTVGALLASHRPKNPIGWIFCGIGFLYGVRRLAIAYADYALLAHPSLPGGEFAAWTSAWLRFSGLTFLVVLLVLLFPNGRLPTPRWRRAAAWVATGGAAMLALGEALRFGPLLTYYYVYNPFGVVGSMGGLFPAHRLFEVLSIAGGVLLWVSCLTAIASLIPSLRQASGEERQQLKWFAYAAVPAAVGSGVIVLDWTVERSALLFLDKTVLPMYWVVGDILLSVEPDGVHRIVELRLDTTVEFLTVIAILIVPICTGVAILRHHLYATDLADNLRALVVAIRTIRWPRILLAGAVVGVLPLAFIYLAVYAYVIFYPVLGQGGVEREQLGRVVALVSSWGARTFFLAITIAVAWWIARKVDTRPTLHGMLVGLVAVVVNQMVVSSFYPQVMIAELPIYFALGIAGGWLGGAGGRTTLAGQVYRAIRRIGLASDPNAVAAAIGEHLGGPELHGIALWQATSQNGGAERVPESKPAHEFVLWGSWAPRDEEVWPFPARLSEAKTLAVTRHTEGPSVVRTASLPADERTHWERRGIDSALLIPLRGPGDIRIGVLMATFRKRRRFSRSTVRAYLTVGAQAALALENMRLIEEAGQAGQKTGVLVERQRLAREIHDTLAQGFAGIITNLSAAQMAEQPVAADGASTRHLEAAKRIARESLAEARRLVWALRPESLDRRSLSEALDRLATEWAEETGVEARAVVTGTPRPLLPEVQVALFRTAQEALANVRKHARADRTNVTLSYMNDRVVLDIVDNGVGFEPARPQKQLGTQDVGGFGLVAIRERIEQLGGTLRVEGEPGEGTTLAAELPIAAQEAKPHEPNARKPGAPE